MIESPIQVGRVDDVDPALQGKTDQLPSMFRGDIGLKRTEGKGSVNQG